jgi:hypothetical protein
VESIKGAGTNITVNIPCLPPHLETSNNFTGRNENFVNFTSSTPSPDISQELFDPNGRKREVKENKESKERNEKKDEWVDGFKALVVDDNVINRYKMRPYRMRY